MKSARLLPTLMLFTAGLFLDPASLRAGTPTDDLLRLVPDNVTFCVVVQKPGDVAGSVWQGPLVESIRKSPLGDAIRQAPELEQLRQLEAFLSQQLDIDFAEVFEKCFGDALVLAYQAGPPGKPELERGVIMSWVRDPKLFEKTLEKLDAAQKQSGELNEIRKLSHLGQSYTRRIKAKAADEFLYFNGSVMAFSGQETVIHDVIARNSAESKTRQSPITRRLQQAGCENAAAAVWINPRSFDAELSVKAREAKDNEAAFLKAFQSCWQALDSVVLGVHVEEHLEFSIALDLKPDRLPEKLRPFVGGTTTPSELWSSFPKAPMFAVAGRTNLPLLIDAIGLFLSPETKTSLATSLEKTLGPAFGKKFVSRIPELLGPDWGVCTSRPSDARQVLPDLFAAIRVSNEAEDADAVRNLMTGLDALATLFRLDYNGKHADEVTKKTLRADGVEVQYLESDGAWPAGLKPAFGLKDNYLIFASKPQLIANFRRSAATGSPPKEVPLILMSFREWQKYLQERGPALIELAVNAGKPKAETEQQLQHAAVLFTFLDRLEVVQKQAPAGQVRLAARLHFAVPLRR